MEKLKKLIAYIRKKLGLRNKSGDADEEIGNYSMNEGKPDKVFGFRREVVKGVAIFFASVLILAFIFASSGDKESEKEIDTLPQASESEIADIRKSKNELPDDYETLMAMNRAKEEELRRQAAQKEKNPPKPEPAETPPVVQTPAPTVPVIPEGKIVSPPSQMPILQEEPVKVETLPKTTSDKYKSAISFGLGEKNKDSSETSVAESKAKPEYSAPNDSTLVAGTVIPVRLLTGINTDVEGQVMVQVLADVYDTATGTKVLIPQGSRVVGAYEKKSVNNDRVPVSFKQVIMPDGGSWSMSETMVAVDGAGFTGISGKVHHHTGQKISAGMVGASIAALSSLAAGNVSSENETYTAGQIATQGAMASLIDTTSTLFKEAANVSNTVTIEPGYEFNIYVTDNIAF